MQALENNPQIGQLDEVLHLVRVRVCNANEGRKCAEDNLQKQNNKMTSRLNIDLTSFEDEAHLSFCGRIDLRVDRFADDLRDVSQWSSGHARKVAIAAV